MQQQQVVVPWVQVPFINQLSHRWVLGYSQRWDCEEKVLDQRSPIPEDRYLTDCYVRVCTEWSLDAVCLLTSSCQAAIPASFESTSLALIFLRSHQSCYQLGSDLADQWKLWRYMDLFFSGIDKRVLQDPHLRLSLANWRLWNFQRWQGEKRAKKAKKNNHSPVCCNSECNQLQTIILSLDTQLHFSWVHGK